MTYTVTITSQGQISIPAKLRKKLNFDKNRAALVTEEDGYLAIRPVKDFLDLAGSLHHKAIKDKSISEIMEKEDRAIEEGFIKREKRFLKQIRKQSLPSGK